MRQAGIRSFATTAIKAAAWVGASSLAFGGQAAAQQFADAGDVAGITVEARNREVDSPKYVAPLLDTPQTITVVDREIIAQQNLLNLRDVLSTLPGITFGAGEGGGGYGDSIVLRGYSANSDVTVDGVRDTAQYSRTDPFDLQQIEVTNGASGVYGGAGSVGGTINLVTKRPMGGDRSEVTIGAGEDHYTRVTADADYEVADGIALRLNVMMHQNDAPGRDHEQFRRFGVAPAVTWGLDGATQFTLLFMHQEDENTPQYGVPYALNAFNNGPLPGVDPRDYFGYRDLDRQRIEVDQLTGILEHQINANADLRNLTRYQVVRQDATTSAVQGAFCLASGINPYTGAPCAAPDTYAPSGPRGNVRNTENTLITNQTDLTLTFETGSVAHTVNAGVVLTREEYELVNGNLLRNPDGSAIPVPLMTLSNPAGLWGLETSFIPGGGGSVGTATASPSGGNVGERDNYAIYLFDAAELSPHWEVNGGVRVERNEGRNTLRYYTFTDRLPAAAGGNEIGAVSPGAPGGVFNGSTTFANEETLVSYRLGLVYKPIESASFYIAYGNSETPSQTAVNGACTAASCNVDPEEAVNYELGWKWDAMGGRMQLTGAVFRNERTNFRVNSGDPSVPLQQLDGRSRVDGVALGAAGFITDDWTIFANYTYLDSEILQNISDIAIAGGALDFQAGDPLPVTPKHAFSLWTTVQTPIGVMFGYGATYQGRYTFNRVSAASPLFYTEPYWVHRIMVSYELADHATLQLNVNNLTDELYYTRIRNNATNGWATPGDARNATLSLNLHF